MRGYCYCGDTYGRYGVKLPNKTAGLTGLDFYHPTGDGMNGFCRFLWHIDALVVSGCFQIWGYPQIIHFNRIFHYKPSILGVSPLFLETPIYRVSGFEGKRLIIASWFEFADVHCTYVQYVSWNPEFSTVSDVHDLQISEGCDCSGPYFAYQSNCVWEQTTGRYGQEPWNSG